MKVALVINAVIGPTIRGGPGKEGYEIAKGLLNKGVLSMVYCHGAAHDSDIPSYKIAPFCKNRILRKLLSVIDRLHKRYPAISGRRRVEQWMDSTYSRKLKPEKRGILYSPKPIYPKTFERAAELGITVLVETSVLHPRFNLEVVGKERKRLGINGAAGYTDEKRVCNIERALVSADYIFAWSNFIKNSYIRYGVPEEKFLENAIFSPPGVDNERFIPAESAKESFIVLHLSSISVIKGVQYLLDAWERIADDINGKLLLIGPIDHDMQQILNRKKRNDIEWLGQTADPIKYYQQASVFVSPSISDAGPRTVLEAMACAVPAIVSTNCGVAETIKHGVDGMIYCYDDIDSLADHMKWAFKNRAELNRMGERARQKVKAYLVDKYSENVYARIMQVSGREGHQ